MLIVSFFPPVPQVASVMELPGQEGAGSSRDPNRHQLKVCDGSELPTGIMLQQYWTALLTRYS